MLPALSFSFVNSNAQTLIITLRNLEVLAPKISSNYCPVRQHAATTAVLHHIRGSDAKQTQRIHFLCQRMETRKAL
jgi:hypothetical protein